MITKSRTLALCFSLGLGLCLCLPAWAARELFNETEAKAAPLPAFLEKMLQNIEPASGSIAPEDETPAATGHSEGTKSFSGKDMTGVKPLPMVKIGTQVVQRTVERLQDTETSATPTSLRTPAFAQVLQHRFNLTPFAHSPRLGSPGAPLMVVMFEDLSCVSGTTESKKISTVLQSITEGPNASATQIIWVHASNNRWQGTNLPAFYAKVAGQYGKFWAFRQAVVNATDSTPEGLFTHLTTLGLEPRALRQTMLTEARRFYRELDSDLLQARSFGIGSPPIVFVNGIRVGESGVPMDLLPDVITYVQNRYNAGLKEPPF
jgi:hypothetical protein